MQVGAEPVVEVLPEAAAAIPCSSESRFVAATILPVEAPRLGLADAVELAALQHAQQLHLDRGVELADLVQEDRAVRPAALEPPGAVLDGAGEGAAAVPEQLRLDERRRSAPTGSRPGSRASRVGGEGLRLRVERDVAARARWRAPPAPCRCPTRR